MEGSGPYIQLLAQIPAFAVFDDAQLQTLYSFCALKVLAKGEAASIAGAGVDELGIVVTGRIAAREGAAYEAGRGQAVEAAAFLTRTPARATAVALRETVLLTLGWEDLAAAFQASPDLIGAVLSRMGAEHLEADRARPVPGRIVICPAGAGRLAGPPGEGRAARGAGERGGDQGLDPAKLRGRHAGRAGAGIARNRALAAGAGA